MAVPKRRTSKSRRDKRRTHKVLPLPVLTLAKNAENPIATSICENAALILVSRF